MKVITANSLMAFDHEHDGIINHRTTGLPLSARDGHEVTSYRELLKKVAALHFHNPRFRILFRGQSKDYRLNMRGQRGIHSSLYPSILRPSSGKRREELLDERFRVLASAEQELKNRLWVHEIHHNQIVRWAILQHYEVCPTPLLDVTPSLQSGLSFALLGGRTEGYLYALAFPQLTGPVSVSIETMTQVIDLSQVCPSEALRPHFQVGMLVSDYPVVDSRESSDARKGFIGNNFSCRLITKFKLSNCGAWASEGWSPAPENILFPNSDDEWWSLMTSIKQVVNAQQAAQHGRS